MGISLSYIVQICTKYALFVHNGNRNRDHTMVFSGYHLATNIVKVGHPFFAGRRSNGWHVLTIFQGFLLTVCQPSAGHLLVLQVC